MRSVVTIGTFDGVHRGHQALIAAVIDRARQFAVESTVVTFEPVPVSVLRPEAYQGRISAPSEKLRLLQETGVEHIDVIPFTLELAAKSPEEFVSGLVERLGMIELWVGDDFALGRNRSGNVDVLRTLGHSLGYETVTFERIPIDGQPISSTVIRGAIRSGNVALAAELLGRPFRLSGEVIHGAHLGRKIGFPTANFVPPPDLVQLADGIYASYGLLPGDSRPLPAMTYVGTRPTVDGGDRQIETNILDFDGDLYGKVLTVDLVARVRADQTFGGLEALIEQLRRDEQAIREILRNSADFGPVRVDPGMVS